ncbi:MAG: phosphopyruvate hydratase [Candidatus Woesearchaeota archaeon]
MRINEIHARQIIDSRGSPTIEVELLTNTGVGRAIVPSGASTGVHEALELRDNKKNDYFGKGVFKAIKNVSKISNRLKNYMIDDQRLIDEVMLNFDGTKNKSNLGANAILGVSMAASRAASDSHKMHLFEYLSEIYDPKKKYVMPVPFANIINGGVHSGNDLMFQEFMVAPIKASSFHEATKILVEVYHELKGLLVEKYGKDSINVGDEGGFAPPLKTPIEALDLITLALKKSGHKSKCAIAMDPAASEFYKDGLYEVEKDKKISGKEFVSYYLDLFKKYNIVSLEDPFDQDDFESWKLLLSKAPKKVQIVGDDLTVSNKERINMALKEKLCNSLLLKINQIGTITEAMESAHLAMENKWTVMVSHRSGETEDTYIADLAVGLGCGQIKLGAPARGERTAKYNQLLRIEDYLKSKSKYAKF